MSKTSPNDTQPVGETTVIAKDLNGTAPNSALPIPEFHALNSDGSDRGQEHLGQQRTVLWFYPITGTPG